MGFLDAVIGTGGLVSAYANWRQAALDRDFQRGMSNTAHQREVQDLMAAGLNPILSATGGAGAATPGGGRTSIGDFGSSALAARRLSQELSNLKAQEEKVQADKINTEADTVLKRRTLDLLDQQIQKTYWDAELASTDVSLKLDQKPGVQANSALLQSQVPKAGAESDIYKSKYGAFLRWLNATTEALRGAGSSARSFDLRR